MDWLDYREKLGIGYIDHEKANYFFTKCSNMFDRIYDENDITNQIDYSEYFDFCNITGSRLARNSYDDNYITTVFDVIMSHAGSLKEFLLYYVAFINCQEDDEYKIFTRKQFCDFVVGMLDESHIPVEVIKDKDGYFIFPKGAKELDDALVSNTLIWLEAYPQTEKIFSHALRQYSEGDYSRDVADNFRKSLEEFFKEFLGNEKNLANNITEIFTYMGKHNAEPELAGMMKTLLSSYDNLNNKAAKHHDKMDSQYLEFLMYQTGIFIRTLIVVKQNELEETENAN